MVAIWEKKKTVLVQIIKKGALPEQILRTVKKLRKRFTFHFPNRCHTPEILKNVSDKMHLPSRVNHFYCQSSPIPILWGAWGPSSRQQVKMENYSNNGGANGIFAAIGVWEPALGIKVLLKYFDFSALLCLVLKP